MVDDGSYRKYIASQKQLVVFTFSPRLNQFKMFKILGQRVINGR